MIILDEGQRIKNWEAKTSRTIKGLKSRFALVLSGTPLENRLDELYSVVEFIDDRRWDRPSSFSTLSVWWMRRAKSWAIRTWTNFVNSSNLSCCGVRGKV